MASILLKNLTISDLQKDVLISGGLIRRIEPVGSCLDWNLAGDVEVMDCTRKTAIPGFINMHTHSAMCLMRGLGEDMKFQDWIARIWNVEKCIDEDFIYWGTRAACLEMFRTGTTCMADHYWITPVGHRAALDAGIRPMMAHILIDRMDPKAVEPAKEDFLKTYEESLSWPETSKFIVGCHAVYSVSEPLLRWAGDFAREHNLLLHIHVSETQKEIEECKAAHGGLSPVEYLNELGLVNSRLIAAHTLWLSEHDVELLGNAGATCVHNINSNLKLASGYRFLYNELRSAGANICIGTDGCASSNNLDMLEAMKTSAMVQKAWRGDPEALPIDELLDCATANAAKALGINAGKLEVGAAADINIIDNDNTFFLSPGSFMANLIYSAHSDCIDSVICKGEFVMKHRELKDEHRIVEECLKLITKIKN